LLSTARQIISETGEIDFPMRKLAAQAQVSLRTPYKLFGSQVGVVRAIFNNDQAVCNERGATPSSTNPLESIFDRIDVIIAFYAEHQPFYRAFFRFGGALLGDDKDERVGENPLSTSGLCQRALDEGYVEPLIDPQLLSDVLADNITGNLRTWALGTSSIALAALKIKLGFALVLTSVTAEPGAPQMRARIRDYQAAIHAL
jgi:AcrR family transcriptional regulator